MKYLVTMLVLMMFGNAYSQEDTFKYECGTNFSIEISLYKYKSRCVNKGEKVCFAYEYSKTEENPLLVTHEGLLTELKELNRKMGGYEYSVIKSEAIKNVLDICEEIVIGEVEEASKDDDFAFSLSSIFYDAPKGRSLRAFCERRIRGFDFTCVKYE